MNASLGLDAAKDVGRTAVCGDIDLQPSRHACKEQFTPAA
jgi:hypothetical protein